MIVGKIFSFGTTKRHVHNDYSGGVGPISVQKKNDTVVKSTVTVTAAKASDIKLPNKFKNALTGFETYARLREDIPKIPQALWNKMVCIFELWSYHRSEIGAWWLYDPEAKEWELYIPPQKVSGTEVEFMVKDARATEKLKNKLLLCVAHSHHSMGAFHSGTDETFELDNNVIQITVAFTDKKKPVYDAQYVSEYGEEIPVSLSEIVEGF